MSDTTTPVRWSDMTTEQRAAWNRERAKIHCSGCPHWWTGLRACHCASCHRSFSGLTSFDKHRDGSHVKATRHCVNPATLFTEDGESMLVLTQKNGWDCWSQPGSWEDRPGEGAR